MRPLDPGRQFHFRFFGPLAIGTKIRSPGYRTDHPYTLYRQSYQAGSNLADKSGIPFKHRIEMHVIIKARYQELALDVSNDVHQTYLLAEQLSYATNTILHNKRSHTIFPALRLACLVTLRTRSGVGSNLIAIRWVLGDILTVAFPSPSEKLVSLKGRWEGAGLAKAYLPWLRRYLSLSSKKLCLARFRIEEEIMGLSSALPSKFGTVTRFEAPPPSRVATSSPPSPTANAAAMEVPAAAVIPVAAPPALLGVVLLAVVVPAA